MQDEPPDPNADSDHGSRIPPGIIEEPGFQESLRALGISAQQWDWAMSLIDLALCRKPRSFLIPTARSDRPMFRIDFAHPRGVVVYVSFDSDGVHLHRARWADEW
jgi:hypothetical protein